MSPAVRALRVARPYLLAVAAVAVAALCRTFVIGHLGRGTYLTFCAAVAAAAWFGGWRVGAAATALSAVFLALVSGPLSELTTDLAGLAFFVVSGLVVSYFADTAAQARRRAGTSLAEAEARAEELRQSNRRLEQEIERRERVEREMRRTDEFVKLALAAADIALFTQDRDLRYTWVVNPQKGFKVAEILGRTDGEIAPDLGGLAKLTAAKQRVIGAGEMAREETTLPGPNGPEHFLSYLRPLRDAQGKIDGLCGLLIDVTERRRLEARYRNVFENRHATMLIIDPADGRIVDANPAAAEFYGWSVEELRRMKVSDLNLMAPEQIKAQMRSATADQHHFFFRHRRADGTERDVEVLSGPIEIDGRHLLLSSVHDITQRREAEEVARAAQNETALLLAEGRISRLALLSVVEDERRSQAALRQSEDNLRRLNLELEQRVRDRTAELEAANKELEAFNYSVSHDLRAPLRAIDGFARILQEDFGPLLPPEGQRVLGIILREEQRTEALVLDLLRLSRLGRQSLDPESINMTELATLVGQESMERVQDRKVDFQVGVLPPAWADLGLIRQVLTNLIDNALKFTRTRPVTEIAITGAHIDREVVYTVSDNGVGFDPARMDRLFGVFQRLHPDKEFEGTGIGLALVKRIVQRHGGRVWAESRVGEGARFHFALPAKVGPVGEAVPLRFSASPFPNASRPD